jgi:tetratricopeptide (TPR) repeat protein
VAFLLPLVLTALVVQQPETMALTGEMLYPPPVPRAERARLEDEIVEARSAVGRAPADPEAALRLARAQRDLGLVRDAIETLTRAIERKTDAPAIRLERGRGLVALRKFGPAEREFRKAVDTIPEAHCDLGIALYLLEDYKQSRQELHACQRPNVFGYLAARRAGEDAGPRPEPPADEHPAAGEVKLPGSVATKKPAAEASMAGQYMDAVDRLIEKKIAAARDLLKPIVEKHKERDWMEPVYVAAEADYARILKAEPKKKKKKKT